MLFHPLWVEIWDKGDEQLMDIAWTSSLQWESGLLRSRQIPKLASFAEIMVFGVFFERKTLGMLRRRFLGSLVPPWAWFWCSWRPLARPTPFELRNRSIFRFSLGFCLVTRLGEVDKSPKFSEFEIFAESFSKTKAPINNPLQRFEALYLGWLRTKYEAKRPSGCEDYRLSIFDPKIFRVNTYLRTIYIRVSQRNQLRNDDFRPISVDFGEISLVARQVYNLRHQWSVWLHIWTRASPGILLGNVAGNFRFSA